MDIGAPELVIVLVVVLLLFGPGRLPGLARSLGEAVHELRGGLRGDRAGDDEPRAAGSAAEVADGDPGAPAP